MFNYPRKPANVINTLKAKWVLMLMCYETSLKTNQEYARSTTYPKLSSLKLIDT